MQVNNQIDKQVKKIFRKTYRTTVGKSSTVNKKIVEKPAAIKNFPVIANILVIVSAFSNMQK